MKNKRTILTIKLSAKEKKLMSELKRIDARIAQARKRKASERILNDLTRQRRDVFWKKFRASDERSRREFDRKYKVVYV